MNPVYKIAQGLWQLEDDSYVCIYISGFYIHFIEMEVNPYDDFTKEDEKDLDSGSEYDEYRTDFSKPTLDFSTRIKSHGIPDTMEEIKELLGQNLVKKVAPDDLREEDRNVLMRDYRPEYEIASVIGGAVEDLNLIDYGFYLSDDS